MTTLSDLQIGDNAKVAGYALGDVAYRRKLLSMGLTLGVQFNVVRVAPMGDPVEIRVRGSNLSLRKAEAAAIQVEKI